MHPTQKFFYSPDVGELLSVDSTDLAFDLSVAPVVLLESSGLLLIIALNFGTNNTIISVVVPRIIPAAEIKKEISGERESSKK